MKIATLYRKDGKIILETDNDALARAATDTPQDVIVAPPPTGDVYTRVAAHYFHDLTGACPAIPADKWPSWADRHCWDKEGTGWFYGPARAGGFAWFPEFCNSDIPMPAGHNWRVPAVRQAAPPIDQGQYAVAVQYAINGLLESGCKTDSVVAKKLRSLLVLIDGQTAKGEGE